MAEKIKVKVKCHVCGNIMEGTAKYGSGHYVPDGFNFDFIATGRISKPNEPSRVKGEVSIVCPHCSVKSKYEI